eukprot:TRINITY_DN67797_c1_g2_i16.p2 TRINITY_DN67797_c1_g2~~TRINITY_DN67797_c1_g2_i16.p2  ORF type:complete len:343 (+),score=27.61 TRINITY_DN67797_c1_g2_i16:161-1189(+)
MARQKVKRCHQPQLRLTTQTFGSDGNEYNMCAPKTCWEKGVSNVYHTTVDGHDGEDFALQMTSPSKPVHQKSIGCILIDTTDAGVAAGRSRLWENYALTAAATPLNIAPIGMSTSAAWWKLTAVTQQQGECLKMEFVVVHSGSHKLTATHHCKGTTLTANGNPFPLWVLASLVSIWLPTPAPSGWVCHFDCPHGSTGSTTVSIFGVTAASATCTDGTWIGDGAAVCNKAPCGDSGLPTDLNGGQWDCTGHADSDTCTLDCPTPAEPLLGATLVADISGDEKCQECLNQVGISSHAPLPSGGPPLLHSLLGTFRMVKPRVYIVQRWLWVLHGAPLQIFLLVGR